MEQLVETFYRRLYSPDFAAAIASLPGTYIEHQYTANFTKPGLLAYVAPRAHHRVNIHKTMSDENFVFLLAEEKLPDGADIARAELFRVKNGDIIEHWSAHVLDEKSRKNSHGTFDGPLPNRAVTYAADAAPAFEALDLRGFGAGDIEAFHQSRTPDYIQHSPKGADGLDGLTDILTRMKSAGMKMIMQPKRILADGDFLMSHRFYDTTPPHPLASRINTFDLFRINADGKATEHWDVMENLPADVPLEKVFQSAIV